MRMKLILVAGARPNFMKVAPLVTAINKYNCSSVCDNSELRTRNSELGTRNPIDFVLVHTGQHYDVAMSENFFKDLGLPKPKINLEVGSASHAVQTGEILVRFEKVCIDEKPDWVIVVGDVNSTMACALVAVKLGIRVAHVEAGLRSFDRTMPEEINRLVTDSIADLLFTPSEDADENLKREGVSDDKIKRVGNIMIDTLISNLGRAREKETWKNIGLRKKQYAFVTLHRPSNVDDRDTLSHILNRMMKLSERMPVVFPVHPRTRKQLVTYGLWPEVEKVKSLKLLEPIGYHDTINLVENSRFVLTDSGGLQEETTFLRIPCLTLRPNTERPVTISQGTNKLTTLEKLEGDFNYLLNGFTPKGHIPDLWDGHTADRIIETLVSQDI